MLKKLISNNKSQLGDSHVKPGFDAFDQRNYQLAIEKLNQAVKAGVKEYDLAEIYMFIGMSHSRLHQYQQAILAYKKALKIDTNSYRAWNNLGIVYADLNNSQEAEKCYLNALAIEPTYAFAMASLGSLYIHRNQPLKAIELSEKAILLVPGMAIAHSNLALAYGMVNRFVEAEKSLKQAVSLGYENWQEVEKRIRNLKSVADDYIALAERLPKTCPKCGSPTSATTVIWTSRTTADCSYCGINLSGEST
ncbi:MAG: hypothetical protein C0410_00640 [Anaerolinea sp.]|nr:hypothetical protein [Anaerolinea sp.]